jgi:hypothetical protein
MPTRSKAKLERVIARVRQTILLYYALSSFVGIVTLTMLVLVNFPRVTKGLFNRNEGNIITAFIGALSLPSFNEIQKRRDRIFRLQLLADEYDDKLRSMDNSADDWDGRCERAIEDVLKG